MDENVDTAHSYHLMSKKKKKGNRMCPQLYLDHFPRNTAHSMIGAIPEICVILSAASNLTSVIHKSLKNYALLNIQEGA